MKLAPAVCRTQRRTRTRVRRRQPGTAALRNAMPHHARRRPSRFRSLQNRAGYGEARRSATSAKAAGLPSPSGALLGLQAPKIVDDVPHVLLGHHALVALHVELRACAVADHREDLAVARSAIPLVV